MSQKIPVGGHWKADKWYKYFYWRGVIKMQRYLIFLNERFCFLEKNIHKYIHAYSLGCPIFHQISPNLLDKRYVDIYGISMGNTSFQSFPMPFRSPTKPIHFTKEIENLRGKNRMPRFFQFLCMKMTFWMTLKPGTALLRSWRFSRHPY